MIIFSSGHLISFSQSLGQHKAGRFALSEGPAFFFVEFRKININNESDYLSGKSNPES